MLKDLQRSASVFALAMLATSPQSVLASEAEIYSLISRAVELGNGGNHHAAIEVMQRALGATSAEYGDQSTEMGEALIAYGKLLFAMRRHGEAVEVHERALAILSSHYGEKSLDLAEARHRLGVSYLGAGRFGDAINTFALIGRVYLATIGKGDPRFVALQIDIFAAYSEVAEPQKTIEMGSRLLKNATIMHGAQSEEVMRVRSILAGTLRTAGQYGRAAEEYIEISRFVEDQRGLADPLTLEMVGSAAYMLLETPGREVEALEYADKAEKVYRRLITAYGETMADQLQVSRDRLDYLGTAVIRTDALWFHGRESRDVLSDVTEQVQRAFLGKTSEAVAEAAARRAVGKRPRLAKMLDDRELYEREYQQIATELQASFSGDRPNTRLDVTELRAKLDRTSDRISTVNRRIDRLAPGLNSLISNEPLALKEAQGMLRKDEAVLMTMPGILGYHVVLLTRDAVRWHRTQLSQPEIDALTTRLAWDLGIEVDAPQAKLAQWEQEGEGAYPYDFETAYTLYRELIEPFADQLEGKKGLYTLLSGATRWIPLGVLVEAVPEGPSGDPATLRNAAWLADRFAVLRVPSLRSINFLRESNSAAGRVAPPRKPFIGIGDPVLGDAGGQRGGASDRKRRIRGATRSFDSSVGRLGSGELADPAALRSLASLPGTERELVAMWEELGQPADALILEEEATESIIRDLELSAEVITFATHGLMAGEMYGLAEPGLVLTPPDQADTTDDGYLSISDIATLDIDADWVILSACNTASPDGSEEGGLGMSGLARSFLFAGARGLLVSHWPVRDDVAPELTVTAVRAMREDPSLSKAEAVQQAMRKVRNDTRADSERDTWAHPGAWAPFSYIGTL